MKLTPRVPGRYVARPVQIPGVGAEVDFALFVSRRGVRDHRMEEYVRRYAADLETVLFRTTEYFSYDPRRTSAVYVYPDPDEFVRVMGRVFDEEPEAAESTMGLFDTQTQITYLQDRSRRGDEAPLGTFIHEYMHAMQHELAGDAMNEVPLWVIEGHAELARIELAGNPGEVKQLRRQALGWLDEHMDDLEDTYDLRALDDLRMWEEMYQDGDLMNGVYALGFFLVESMLSRVRRPEVLTQLFKDARNYGFFSKFEKSFSGHTDLSLGRFSDTFFDDELGALLEGDGRAFSPLADLFRSGRDRYSERQLKILAGGQGFSSRGMHHDDSFFDDAGWDDEGWEAWEDTYDAELDDSGDTYDARNADEDESFLDGIFSFFFGDDEEGDDDEYEDDEYEDDEEEWDDEYDEDEEWDDEDEEWDDEDDEEWDDEDEEYENDEEWDDDEW